MIKVTPAIALMSFIMGLTVATSTPVYSESLPYKGDQARAKKIAYGSCFLCHGTTGELSGELFPKLAGQHAGYIAQQLEAFKSGARKSTAMAYMVSELSPEEILALGKYYERANHHQD